MQPGIAWIIGGGSGLGAAMAKLLAVQGWTVAISGRRVERLEQVVAGTSGQIRPYPLDVTNAAAGAETTRKIAGELGRIDLFIFSAAAWEPMPIADYDAEKFDTIVQTNLMGVVKLATPVIAQMTAQGGGTFAIVSSLAGYFGLPRSTAYNSTKSALFTIAQSMRTELKPRGIDVRVVAPGFFKSEQTAKNDFPMPLLMEVDDAARRTIDGLLNSKRFEIAYPRRLAWAMKLLRALPYPVLFSIADRMMPKR